MDALLRKLQHRAGDPVVVLRPPDALRPVLDGWRDAGLDVRTRLRGGVPFVLAFASTPGEVIDRGPKVVDAVRTVDDPVLWFAYPKRSSPLAHPDLHRDRGWEPLGELGFEGVRQVAVDDDWSALRFRRTGSVASLTRDRSRNISDAGRRRAGRGAVAPEVEAFLADLPEHRAWVRELHELIRAAAPELDVAMWSSTVGYGSYHYRYPSGREGDWFPIGLASNARYVSLYLCASEGDGYLAERHADRLGEVSVGRSCIRVRKPEHLDRDVAAELVRRAADLVAEGRFAM
jgi:hypothetical protein